MWPITIRRGFLALFGARLLVSGLSIAGALMPSAWAQQRYPAERPFGDDPGVALNAEYIVTMQDIRTAGSGLLGTIVLRPAANGVRIIPDIRGLSPGRHGLYIYREPDCGTAPDLDIGTTREEVGTLLSPRDSGRLAPGEDPPGVLPTLMADEQGRLVTAVTATGIDFRNVVGRSLIITDEGQDSHMGEEPSGPEWVACGIVRN